MPSPTEERRKEIVKHLHKVLENHARRCATSAATSKSHRQAGERQKISQDEHKRAIEEMEKISHSETRRSKTFAAKEKEILELSRGAANLSFSAACSNSPASPFRNRRQQQSPA